jgi:hypothetical protein
MSCCALPCHACSGVWALLYIVEATAVDRVLQQHQDKPDVAVSANA